MSLFDMLSLLEGRDDSNVFDDERAARAEFDRRVAQMIGREVDDDDD